MEKNMETADETPFSGTCDNETYNSIPKKTIYVPENFRSIIGDFIYDLDETFPEYSFLWHRWGYESILEERDIIELFEYVLKVFPERFFDILYQNDEIFEPDSGINTMFLPNVDFKIIFRCDGISENTKKTIWKYLQLILFSILNSIKDKSKFGETMNIFEGLDESILQEKLQETIVGMNEFFTNIAKNKSQTTEEEGDANEESEDNDSDPSSKTTFDFENNMPNPEELHDHLKTLFDGKIGKLAKELAEEISEDINQFIDKDDMENVRTSQDVIKTLLKNPKKMMDLVKNVGNKLNQKMESGEISQEEIMKEAGELFTKMKEMKGTKHLNEMFKNMAKQMGVKGNGMRTDTNAMENKLKNMQLKEKLRKRLQMKKGSAPNSSSTDSPNSSSQSAENGSSPPFHSGEPDKTNEQNPFQEIENIMEMLGLANNNTSNNSNDHQNTASNKNKKKNKKR